MISEFRKKKFLHLYNFFDADSSGSVNKKDFEQSADNISEKQGWAKDSTKYKEAKEALGIIWDSLVKEADSDGDGEVTIQEWLDMWEQFSKNPSSPFKWQSQYCKFIFDVEDASGDGAIDSEEFTKVLQAFGFSKEDSEKAFQKMANGKTSVSWDEFQELWKEYFVSENPSDPGNFIFGMCTFCCGH